MNQKSKAMLAVGILFNVATYAGNELPTCRADSSAGVVLKLGNGRDDVRLEGDPKACETGVTFVPDADGGSQGLVLISATEIGLTSKLKAYRVSFATGQARLLGELPASAERQSPDLFVDITQEAGSLFLETYKVDDNAIRRSETSLELVVSGTVCADRAAGVFVFGVSSNRACARRVVASRRSPVCIVHAGEVQTYLAPRDRCSKLLARWRSGN